MNYEDIAEFVHELVKNPQGLLKQQVQPSVELKTNELAIMQRVCTQHELLGNVAMSEILLPLRFWG